MSHTDPGPMAGYNSLQDRNLVGYFNNDRMRRHLRRSGLINRRGEIVTESTYRMSMARKEHQKHVRDLMAQAIVHKALDMERHRQAAIKKKLEEIAKVELVRRVRFERSRRGDEDIIPFLSPRAPSGRPSSAHSHQGRRRKATGARQRPETAPTNKASYDRQNAVYVDADGFPVHRERGKGSSTRSSSLTSGELDSQNLRELDPRTMNEISLHLRPEERDGLAPYKVNQAFKPHLPKPPGGRGQRTRARPPKKRSSPNDRNGRTGRSKLKTKSSLHRKEPAYPHAGQLQTLCDVTVRYRGNNLKIQYEREDPRDEIMIYQQHCGGENLLVFEGMVEKGNDLIFTSRRHRGYPFSVTFFVNRVQSLRLSACCEYKYTPHSLLGGSKGHFKYIRVEGAAPCYRCMVEAELARRERQRYRGTQTDQPDPPAEQEPVKAVISTQTEEEGGEESKEYEDDFDEDEHRGSVAASEGESSEDEATFQGDVHRGETSDHAFYDSDTQAAQEKVGYTDSEFEDDKSKVTQESGSRSESRAESDAEQEAVILGDGSDSDGEGEDVATEDDESKHHIDDGSNVTDDEERSQVSRETTPRVVERTDGGSESASGKSESGSEVNNNSDEGSQSVATREEGQVSEEVKDDHTPRVDADIPLGDGGGSSHTEVPEDRESSGGEIKIREEEELRDGGQCDSGKRGEDTDQFHEQKEDDDTDVEAELKNINGESSDDDLTSSVRSRSHTSGHNSEDDYRPLSATSPSYSSDSDAGDEVKEKEVKPTKQEVDHISVDAKGNGPSVPPDNTQSSEDKLDVTERIEGLSALDGASATSERGEEESSGVEPPVGTDAKGSVGAGVSEQEDGVTGSRNRIEIQGGGSEAGSAPSPGREVSDLSSPKSEVPRAEDESKSDDGPGEPSVGVSSGVSEPGIPEAEDKSRSDDDPGEASVGVSSGILESRTPRAEDESKSDDGDLSAGSSGRMSEQESHKGELAEAFAGGDAKKMDQEPNLENASGVDRSKVDLSSRGDGTGEGGDQEITQTRDQENEDPKDLGEVRENLEPGHSKPEVVETEGSGQSSEAGGKDGAEESEISPQAEADDDGDGKQEGVKGGKGGMSDSETEIESNSGGESETSSSEVSETRSPVTVLNLNEKGITAERALRLAASLVKPRYSHVQYLLIRSNPVGDKGLTAIVQSLIELHHRSPPDDDGSGSTSGLGLTHLDLGDSGITNRGINELAELLKLPTRLENLNLSDNVTSKLGWLALAAGLRENKGALRTLSVEYMGLGDEGCREICEAATDSRTLTELNLEGNGIGEAGGEAILKMLTDNERIETVNFERDNNIPAHICQEIKDLL